MSSTLAMEFAPDPVGLRVTGFPSLPGGNPEPGATWVDTTEVSHWR